MYKLLNIEDELQFFKNTYHAVLLEAMYGKTCHIVKMVLLTLSPFLFLMQEISMDH